MGKQFKYSAMVGMTQRTIAVGGTILINLVFGLCGYFRAYGLGGMITAVCLSSLALFAVLIVCIIADFESIKNLFSAPSGYMTFLTPVPRWKILLGRLLPMVVLDLVTLIIGIIGVVVQSLLLAGVTWGQMSNTASNYSSDYKMLFWLLLIVLLNYMILLLTLFFAAAFHKTVLFRVPGKSILTVAVVIAVFYLFNLFNFALMPVTSYYSYNYFYTFNMSLGLNAATFVYFGLDLLKLGLLFCGTTYLMERKINL